MSGQSYSQKARQKRAIAASTMRAKLHWQVPFWRGVAARRTGEPCPYPAGSYEAKKWQNGFRGFDPIGEENE